VVQRLILAFAFALLGAALFAGSVGAESLPAAEKQKIEALIEYVASANDVKFVRNGTVYNAASAATFLRRKWQANYSAVHSARDFVEKIATISGTSGKPYLIRLKDGSEIKSREFLLGQLEKIE
jgi:Family of unknown function (DUF5329)